MTTDPYQGSAQADRTSGMREELDHDAGRLMDSVGARAKQEAEARKGQAASAFGSASSAINSAADEVQQDTDASDWLAAAMKQAAGKIETMASQIEGRNIDQIGRDVSDFARRRPGTFLAASAAAGFAVARVLRAGIHSQHHDQADHRDDTTGRSRSASDQAGSDHTDQNSPQPNRPADSAVGDLAGSVERDIGGVAP